MTKKATEKQKALLSRDPNRVLLVFYKAAATALYYNSMNAVTASKISDAELLKLPRIGRSVVSSIRRVVELCNT